ncbi:MAG: RHS repeat-associated core domain-containing protein [Planctomycetia bacterium]|nr:RHS repeat-associated core domain-containing protein [Planctomycetia bacterium]
MEYLNSLDGSTSYNYDFLGQLISADYANQNLTDESYSYDTNGNRLTANGSAYTTGTNNELTSDSNWTYTYDDEGNRLTKTNSTNSELYEWDYRNRLTSVTQQTYDTTTSTWTTTQIVEYTYDYNNVWIRKTLDTNGDGTADAKTIFIPENYQTAMQLDDTNLSDNTGPIVTHHYLWTPQHQDKLLADTTTSGILWSLTDHLGTVRDIVGTTETTHLIYDAFGNLTSGTNPILFGYTGKAFDADTQLQNNINRWYDSATGRWLSTDPIGFEGNDTNLYRYVGNNPPRYIDYLGLELVAPWHPDASWRPSDTYNAWKNAIHEAFDQVKDIAKQTLESLKNAVVAVKNYIEGYVQQQLDRILPAALAVFQENPSVSFDRQLRWEGKLKDSKLIGALVIGAKYNTGECSIGFRLKPVGTLQVTIPIKNGYTRYTLGSSPVLRVTLAGNLSKKYYLETKQWNEMEGVLSGSPSGAMKWDFEQLKNWIGDHGAEVGTAGKFQIYPTIKAQGASVYGRFYWQSPGWFGGTHRQEWKLNWGLFGSGAEAEIL